MTAPTCLLALSLLITLVPSPHTPITPASMPPRPAVRSETEARQLTRHAHRLTISGSVLLITSGAAWGVMLGAMVLGAHDRRQHNELVAQVNAEDRPLRPDERDYLAYYARHGSRDNTMAVTGAIVGAAMTIVGAALLGRGLILKRRQQGRLAPLRVAASWRPAF